MDKIPRLLPHRLVVYLPRRSFLVDDSLVHIQHPRGNVPGKSHFMRNDHHGHAVGRQLADDGQHLAHHGRVQRGRRLVKQDDFRLHGQGPGNGYPLLLSARQFIGVGICFFRQPHPGEQLHAFRKGLPPSPLQKIDRPEHNIFDHHQMRKKIEGLKHHAHFPPDLKDIGFPVEKIFPVDDDFTPGRHLQKIEAAQKRAFSAAGRADDGNHLAFVDFHIHIFENNQPAEGFGQMSDADHGRTPPFTALLRRFGSTRISTRERRPAIR
ncbi:MAG: hypothetical protein BWX45_00478 [Deltaproteobacteria bacterium ADurb.Bin002]|nr:MAG: hypothetical protein BWX45_00478 [Deltaproteobacteria bacterium ADurb.Bin002]